jgi:succinoglycan biosynthesis protein ExoO
MNNHEAIEVSVVMPAYNAEKTIEKAIRSILDQSLQNLEILVCDDASTDRTAEIVRSIADSRVHLYVNPHNMGPGQSRDRLIQLAQGRWVAFMDADDTMQPDRLRYLVSIAAQYPGSMVFDDICECHDTGHGMVPFRRVYSENAFSARIDHGSAKQVTLPELFSSRRTLMKPLVPLSKIKEVGATHLGHKYGEDCAFFWTLAARGVTCYYVPAAMYNYRITPGSASANPDRSLLFSMSMESLLHESISVQEQEIIRERVSYLKDLATLKRARSDPVLNRFVTTVKFLLRYWRKAPFFISDILTKAMYTLSRIRTGARGR